MAFIHIPKGWEIPEGQATPESVYMNRRRFLKDIGIKGLGVAGLVTGLYTAGCGTDKSEYPRRLLSEEPTGGEDPSDETDRPLYPAPRNPAFMLHRSITDEAIVARYNNFYEFTTDKESVWKLVERFEIRPWEIEVAGLVEKPGVYDVYDLIRRMPLEERLYRFRCVEAWAMAVPWTGFPMRALIDYVQPTSLAKFVRFVTFLRPEQAPGHKYDTWYPWPYVEGLTMAEATNELTLLVTGIYGHELPKQNGAPIRLIVPWKYGFKSIKSIVRIEFTVAQPATFWNTASPKEYDFGANVNPEIPHPRWSQETEVLIGTGERLNTLLYNGYGDYVAHLYG